MRFKTAGALVVLVVACSTRESATYAIGRAATSDEIAAWDIDINAAGVGLPAGSGSATDGARHYASLCASCHGVQGEGSSTAAQLVRPSGSGVAVRRNIATHWPYAPPLLDYVRRGMPPDRPQPLGADTLYSLVAFLLEANRIVAPAWRADSATLRRVAMPARPHFVTDDRRGGRELR